MSTATLEVDATMQSFMGWVGGKRALAKTIVALLPEHTCYVEVFGGAGWVLFAKQPAKAEVYNDLHGRLVELFRTVKYHPEELVRELDLLVPSREMFEAFREQAGLTEIQRAARFYYVTRMSFGKKGDAFGYQKTPGGARLGMDKLQVHLEAVRQRLEGVTVEHRDFEQVLGQFDGADTLFFVDPPYYGAEGHYDVRFEPEDHDRLRAVLGRLTGKWLLTYNDHAWVRRAYAGFHRYGVTAPYLLNVRAPKPGHQLIGTNYRPTGAQIAAAPRDLRPIRAPRKRPSRRG